MRKILPLLLLSSFFLSCGIHRIQTSDVSPDHINEMAYIEPIAYVDLIEKGNKMTFSDSLSGITKAYLDSIITNDTRLRVSRKLEVADNVIRHKLEEELEGLFQKVVLDRKIDNIPLSPGLDSLLTANNYRFAMAIIGTGFGRKKGNYTGQVVKGTVIGILTLGLYVPVPIKSNITLYTAILDSQENNIAFFRRSRIKEKSPTDPEVLAKELEWTFNGYFDSMK